jgi:HEAT repeat protein
MEIQPMPRKKNSSKRTETRYTSMPSKADASKVKKIAAKSVETKSVEPKLSAVAETVSSSPAKARVESPATSAATALIAALRHSDADIARDAATSLGALGELAAVEPLIQVLSNADGYYHAVVRSAAAASLGRLGDARSVDALLDATRDSLAEPSAEAIRALAAIGDARAINQLIDVVRNPSGFFLGTARRAAVVALAHFRTDERAAAELQAVSTNSWEDAVIRQAAIDALGRSAKNGAAD